MHRSALFAAAFATLLAMPSPGRDVFVPPVSTVSPGYLFSNDQYQRDRQESRRGGVSRQQSVDVDIQVNFGLEAAARVRVQADLEALVPDCHERFKRHGEAGANEWISTKASEPGQFEAEPMRQRHSLEKS